METLSSNTNAPNSTPGRIRQALMQEGLGSLPVVLGLILIAAIFQAANPNFLTPLNLTNLLMQIAAVGTIAVGVVLVLLIGEIDLSVGAVSGVCAAFMAVLSVNRGVPAPLAIGAGLLAGIVIGVLQGTWIAKLRVPSFVVTLAGLLGWQGALLYILGDTGTINLTDPLITGITNARLPLALGWIGGIAVIGVYGFGVLRTRRRRTRAGLAVKPLTLVVGRIVLIAIGVLAAVGIMSIDRNPTGDVPIRGIPSGVVCLIFCIVAFDLITRRTRFGRAIFAVGGNAEAARRAGIAVDRVRIAVFALSAALAAFGGILAGSRLFAVNQSSGSGELLLDAIAAAVIGGTSLFGGRGSVWSALLGALVIGSIANGMDLLALSSSIKFMITGAVLLVAVTIDAYARARRERQ